ncbi:hypothetical protein OIB37_29465 [Streptomyces sp. NBC_00820]|uniref:hypothetical protein n=1 Tax=Streptomyces sp. NBC_00820 TaxID=2975842 RepID=UPI002ED2986A|nr:hypothetical protein [Streptomyces sp. NBC_00820]WTI16951.1 hypothetical protein OIB37_29465 [Streptomyces sp. NBC_00820]
MRSLPLPLALSARLSPVVVLACVGWTMAGDPAPPADAAHQSAGQHPADSASAPSSDSAASSPGPATKTYANAPAPCTGVPVATIKSLVPGAKTAGKEIPSTDSSLRRTCSWNALDGYNYRWLDVSYEISASDQAATKEYQQRVEDKSGGGSVPGIGDAGYSVVNLSTEDKQQTREGVVMVRVANALAVVTYSGSDFESKKAPSTDVINKGAIKAAKSAVASLQNAKSG